MPRCATRYIAWVFAIAALTLFLALTNWECQDARRFAGCLFLTILGSTLKVRLPGIAGTFSLSFVFILMGIADLSLAEVLLMSCAAATVQCLWRTKHKPELVQIMFSVSNLVIAVAVSYGAFHLGRRFGFGDHLMGLLALAAGVQYVFNTGFLSIVLALVEDQPVKQMWEHWVVLSFPEYLAGAVLAGAFTVSSQHVDWKACLLLTPMLYLVYICYRTYIEKRGDEQACYIAQ